MLETLVSNWQHANLGASDFDDCSGLTHEDLPVLRGSFNGSFARSGRVT
jgi:hypothetical protein